MAPVGQQLTHVGNCSQFDLTFAEENATQRDYQTAGGGSAAKLTRVSAVNGAVSTFSFNRSVLRSVLRAAITEIAAEATQTVNHEIQANSLNPLILLDKPIDRADLETTFSVHNTGADGDADGLGDGADADTDGTPGSALVEGEDYILENNSVQILQGVAAGDIVQVQYSAAEGFEVQPLTEAQANYRIVFDGLNEANDNKPVLVEIYCAALDVAGTINLISGDTDFGALPFTFEILKDSSVTGAGLSQYMKLSMAS